MGKEIITEEYTLPSLGNIYKTKFNPEVKLRSMTVAEEMKRLSPSKNPYKTMSEIIEDCLVEKLPIPVYNLCIGDYTYLLHKLRVTTYGPDYVINYRCPVCGNNEKIIINLDDIEVFKYNDSIINDMSFTLPKLGNVVKLRFQTPRDLDTIERKKREFEEKFPDHKEDQTILLTLESLIDTIDDEPLDPILGKEWLRQLNMMDMNTIAQKATQLQSKIGVNNLVNLKCSKCGNEVTTPFRYTSEFFGPSIG